MFEQLPEKAQKQVIHYLEKDNFIQAKKIYDSWLTWLTKQHRLKKQPPSSTTPPNGNS